MRMGGGEHASAEDGGYSGMALVERALILTLGSLSVAIVVRLVLYGICGRTPFLSRFIVIVKAAFSLNWCFLRATIAPHMMRFLFYSSMFRFCFGLGNRRLAFTCTIYSIDETISSFFFLEQEPLLWGLARS